MSIFFSQGNYLVVLACLYLMLASFAGIRGSFRAEKKMVDAYYLALLIFMGIYAVAFLIYMLVDGVAPTARNRSVEGGIAYFRLCRAVRCSAPCIALYVCLIRCSLLIANVFFLLQLWRVVFRGRLRFGLHFDGRCSAEMLRSLCVGDEDQSAHRDSHRCSTGRGAHRQSNHRTQRALQ